MMIKIIQVNTVNQRVRWEFEQAGRDCWVAWCDPLGLTVEAKTHSELMATLQDAHDDLLVDLLRTGDLHDFLRERNWTLASRIPKGAGPDSVRVEVPYEVMAAQARHSLQRAADA